MNSPLLSSPLDFYFPHGGPTPAPGVASAARRRGAAHLNAFAASSTSHWLSTWVSWLHEAPLPATREGIVKCTLPNSYDDLHRFSITRANDFWLLLWRYFGIVCSASPRVAVDESISFEKRPTFFAGARLNYAENVLARDDGGVALLTLDETILVDARKGPMPSRVSRAELRDRTERVAAALRGAGVLPGNVVAYLGSNTANAVVTQLATAAIGAIFTSLAADMGEASVVERLTLVKPTVVFAEAGYQYNGKVYITVAKASRVILTLRRHARNPIRSRRGDALPLAILVSKDGISDAGPDAAKCSWLTLEDFLHSSPGLVTPASTFAQVPFDHPMLILFSSGTTGAPKGIVHSHGGVLVNLLKEHVLHENMGPADIYFHYSNIGWTMWNIFLGGLLAGATLVLYDGSPFYPSPSQNLQTILSIGTTVFGASPRYYDELRKRDIIPKQTMDTTRLRLLGNTGANLPAALWSWLAEGFGGKPIFSFSGGTEICGSFLHGILTKPHFPGQITVSALGVDAAALDSNGATCKTDMPGELVCRRAIPNAAIGLWDDADGKRYHKSYFSQYPGVWTQGDFCKFNIATGGITMLGRSDGTLNPSGVRFGSAEIYSIMDKDFRDSVVDSLCVGQQIDGGNEEVFLFLQMPPKASLTRTLEAAIRARIAEVLSRRHAPSQIHQIPKVPYNVNGKKLEVPVKRIISGQRVDDKVRATLMDKEELDHFRRFVGVSLNFGIGAKL